MLGRWHGDAVSRLRLLGATYIAEAPWANPYRTPDGLAEWDVLNL